ncbi:hypothetical protein QBC41DRAFT_377859 [Cercophora samala]|uniref:Trafficking protein particle complex subunit 13 N-terminal domain-containing protein n=1 Tax=Cercophora samala TaxID=330535 RepID=A0AA40DF27_9PEZI|nr:hypothetical protein QBC41DRAFT_377859 [Cercophora samala]
MSHQRHFSDAAVKEPHSVSLKVLRLTRPSLVSQYPLSPPLSSPTTTTSSLPPSPLPASLSYSSTPSSQTTNPHPFLLSPILALPPSFGSAHVGTTFSCTLCANHDIPPPIDGGPPLSVKTIRDVKIEAEMKTPSSPTLIPLLPPPPSSSSATNQEQTNTTGVDLTPGSTLQKIVKFDLREEGAHTLAVQVSYYEATETSGRTRTFKKLYQFVCKGLLVVRTKTSALGLGKGGRRRWVLEAQVENAAAAAGGQGEEGGGGGEVVYMEEIGLELERGLTARDVNFWGRGKNKEKVVLRPGEGEEVVFIVEEEEPWDGREEGEGRKVFGTLQIGWRGEMGARGFLATGRLGTRFLRPREQGGVKA